MSADGIRAMRTATLHASALVSQLKRELDAIQDADVMEEEITQADVKALADLVAEIDGLGSHELIGGE